MRRRVTRIMLVSLAGLLAAPALATASVPFKKIGSPGPLQSIWVGNDLSCQVKLTQDSVNSYFPPNLSGPGDCGLFVAEGATIYSPNWAEHVNTAVTGSNADGIPFAPHEQVGPTGAGTAANPFRIVTTASIPFMWVVRTDTYVTGSNSWNVHIGLHNVGDTTRDVTVYHAGDCYLAESDLGFAWVVPHAGSVFCTSTPHNSPPGRLIGFSGGAGANYFTGDPLDDFWDHIDGTPYPNTCLCSSYVDNAAGLSWTRSVPPHSSAEIDLTSTLIPPPAKFVSNNNFQFRKLQRIPKRGIARQAIWVPGPGHLVIRGRNVRRVVRNPGARRVLRVPIRAKGKAQRRLNRTGRTRFPIVATFRPRGGNPRTRTRRVPLVKRSSLRRWLRR